MPATAICWSTYEFFKFMLSNENSEQYRSSVLSNNDISSKSQSKICNPSTESTLVNTANVRYVIPSPPVISTEILTKKTGSLHNSTSTDSAITGSQYTPTISRELPSISGVGVYTAINMKPIHTDRVFDPNVRGCSR